ncbi:MAG: SdiA-regulated domain-containing protein [Flavobacteriales bacterium]
MFARAAILIALVALSARPAPEMAGLPYDLRRPDAVFTLPAELTEISALTDVDERTVACVQDEAATLYFVSVTDGSVLSTVPFSGPADMEGLTRVNGDYFALRSDGLVHHLRMRARPAALDVLDTFRLDVDNRNIEGLGFDPVTGNVLVSPKDFVKGDKELRDERLLYAFDPRDATHKVRVALRLSVAAVVAQARAAGIAVPERTTPNGRVVPAVKLRLSSVAVHPATGHYYLLSAVDRLLLVVDRSARLVALEQLDAGLLPKPEGITFLPNGDLVLSSEGKGSAPVIARYRSR